MDSNPDAVEQLVVLGASAGGIEALRSVLRGIDSDFPAPIVIAQHLDPTRPSHLAEILARETTIPVHMVGTTTKLEAGAAYILPGDKPVEVARGELRIKAQDGERPAPSIDRTLATAAASYGEGVTAVILSGTGADGAVGARQVKAAGGTVVIQNPDTAAYPSMPLSIAVSLVDIVADAEAIGAMLGDLVSTPRLNGRGDGDKRLLRTFLEGLRERSGIDFGSYKRGTIMRRLHRRMLATGTADLAAYAEHVQANPSEYQRLTSSFLIKVTEFFRDGDLFDFLRDEVLPGLIEHARETGHDLRLWSAGCATGEEAYSLAMLVADAIGDELPRFNVRIFATDVDVDAVGFARRGIYPPAAVQALPADLRERHFTRVGEMYEVRKTIRAMTVFGQHDLGQRAPFPRVDLALCRNVLIYFTTELQRRALQLFAFALRPGGYLALGKAESTSPLPDHFATVNPRLKVFRRVGERVLIPPARVRDASPVLLPRMSGSRRTETAGGGALREALRPIQTAERQEQLILRLPVGVVVVDSKYDVQVINAAARRQLGIHARAVGDDLIHLLPEAIGTQVRSLIDETLKGGRPEPVQVEVSSPRADGTELRIMELSVHPIPPGADDPIDRVFVVTVDVTNAEEARRRLDTAIGEERLERDEVTRHARELATANETLVQANLDLSTANAELRSANEEMLVAGEEVQAATEEVETLNEELQATNEELETLNEELQATVEELNTTNDDLESRTLELQESASQATAEQDSLEGERLRLLAVLDILEEPVLLVTAAGEVAKANQSFLQIAGEGDPTFRDEAGVLLEGAEDPRRRATAETFGVTVSFGRKLYDLRGRPAGPAGDGYGVLTLRPRP